MVMNGYVLMLEILDVFCFKVASLWNVLMIINQITKRKKKRIIASGGHVTKGRCNGVISVSRSIGDYNFK